MLENCDFETGSVDPWHNVASQVAISSSYAHSGTYGVRISERTASWAGFRYNLLDKLEAGVEYEVSAFVRWVDVPDDYSESFRLTIRQQNAGSSDINYFGIISEDVGNVYKQISGFYTLDAVSGDLTLLELYTASSSSLSTHASFDIDNVVFKRATPPNVPDYYVGSDESSEIVTIPEPNTVDLNVPRTNCPHMEDNGNIFAHLEHWENLFPTEDLYDGVDIVIPAGKQVLVSSSIATNIGLITIPATSELIIGDDANGIEIDAEGIDVQGALIAGSESCRIETPITVTLHGARPSDIVSNGRDPSFKGISVTGNLQLHGKRYFRTWTRLARRAHEGDTSLLLQHEVNWEPGQQIVLVTSALRDSRDWHENEVLVVDRVETSLGGINEEVASVVHVTTAISYAHIAQPGYQVEVGLLSRMIVIQGADDDSEPTDSFPLGCDLSSSVFGYSQAPCDNHLTGFGGHVMIHSGGVGQVEGVELFRMGQTNVLGRYPIHFHLLGTCSSCYFKDSSVHRSFYRCISIHGTNEMTVSENVAYDVTGFCYYLEDGVEEDNILSFNLAAHIHTVGETAISGGGQTIPLFYQSDSLTLPADVTASGFYITNMHNQIIGNAASGGWSGFAFPVLQEPLGPHRDEASFPQYAGYNPSSRVSLAIDGNTAHSTAWWWSHAGAVRSIDCGYPDRVPNDPIISKSSMVNSLYSHSAFHCFSDSSFTLVDLCTTATMERHRYIMPVETKIREFAVLVFKMRRTIAARHPISLQTPKSS